MKRRALVTVDAHLRVTALEVLNSFGDAQQQYQQMTPRRAAVRNPTTNTPRRMYSPESHSANSKESTGCALMQTLSPTCGLFTLKTDEVKGPLEPKWYKWTY